jgi:hypothetical protein
MIKAGITGLKQLSLCVVEWSGGNNFDYDAIGLTFGGSSAVHIYTQTIHRTTQLTTSVEGFLGLLIPDDCSGIPFSQMR